MELLPQIPLDQTLFISKEGLKKIIENVNSSCPERNFLYTSDYKVELPIRMKKHGFGSE